MSYKLSITTFLFFTSLLSFAQQEFQFSDSLVFEGSAHSIIEYNEETIDSIYLFLNPDKIHRKTFEIILVGNKQAIQNTKTYLLKYSVLDKQIILQQNETQSKIILSKAYNPAEPSFCPVAVDSIYPFRRFAPGFGYRLHPILRTKVFHSGIDFSTKRGTPIYAAMNGIIEVSEDTLRRGDGHHIMIKHNAIYKTRYHHMQDTTYAGLLLISCVWCVPNHERGWVETLQVQ